VPAELTFGNWRSRDGSKTNRTDLKENPQTGADNAN
jgi:hypothetical protein